MFSCRGLKTNRKSYQTKVALSWLRSTCPLLSFCFRCLLAWTMEGRSEVWYTADLILLPRQRSSRATPSHFLSSSESWEPRGSREPLRVGLVSSGSEKFPILSKSKARFDVPWWDEGDFDLRRERTGGRGGGAGAGDGEGWEGLEDVVLRLETLKPPFSLLLPLHRSLSLPKEKEPACKERWQIRQKEAREIGTALSSTANMQRAIKLENEQYVITLLNTDTVTWTKTQT